MNLLLQRLDHLLIIDHVYVHTVCSNVSYAKCSYFPNSEVSSQEPEKLSKDSKYQIIGYHVVSQRRVGSRPNELLRRK